MGVPCWPHDAILKAQRRICYNVGFSIVDLDMIESVQISVAGFLLCSWFIVTRRRRLEHSTGSASRFVSHEPAASFSVTNLPTYLLTRAVWDAPGLNENRPSVGTKSMAERMLRNRPLPLVNFINDDPLAESSRYCWFISAKSWPANLIECQPLNVSGNLNLIKYV